MRPFEGVKILDCTHVLAGPFAAYQLAVLGADVIKVEDPNEPDQSRESGADMALNKTRMGTGFSHAGLEQALDRAQPQDRRRARSVEAPGQGLGRRAGRKLPARRVQGARPRLRGPVEAETQARLRVDDRLRSGRAARQPDRVRHGDPGDLRLHRVDRHAGQRADQNRRAGDRLRDRHHRRVCDRRGALPDPAHRQGPVHRHGDAGRRAHPAGYAHHRPPALGAQPEAQRQQDALCRVVAVRNQGRPRAARGVQRAPASPFLHGDRRAGRGRAREPRRALRALRRKVRDGRRER